jgi:molybdenum cofactor cytidylyltransferase
MQQPKMLLPWGDTTVLGHLIRVWNGLRAQQISVVLAAGDEPILRELDALNFPVENRISNPDASRGMFSSILCAAQWKGWQGPLTHIALVLGDQPHLQDKTLARLLQFAGEHPDSICQPSFQGRPKHPIVFPMGLFAKVEESRHSTLREFLAESVENIRRVEINDSGLNLDLDYPADYDKARAHYLRQQCSGI